MYDSGRFARMTSSTTAPLTFARAGRVGHEKEVPTGIHLAQSCPIIVAIPTCAAPIESYTRPHLHRCGRAHSIHRPETQKTQRPSGVGRPREKDNLDIDSRARESFKKPRRHLCFCRNIKQPHMRSPGAPLSSTTHGVPASTGTAASTHSGGSQPAAAPISPFPSGLSKWERASIGACGATVCNGPSIHLTHPLPPTYPPNSRARPTGAVFRQGRDRPPGAPLRQGAAPQDPALHRGPPALHGLRPLCAGGRGGPRPGLHQAGAEVPLRHGACCVVESRGIGMPAAVHGLNLTTVPHGEHRTPAG